MSTTYGSMIAASARLAMVYNDRLSGDIPDKEFGMLPRQGEVIFQANHPAFILGHLAIYPSRIVSELGGDDAAIAPSEADNELFSPKASCIDDPERTIYPPKAELVERIKRNYAAAIEAIESAPDSAFQRKNPNERMRDKFATIGAMHGFYVGGHFMMHMGQLSTWRRVMNLGPA